MRADILFDEQFARCPAMEPCDFYKLIYQQCFGCGHAAPDESTALALLREEYAETGAAPLPETAEPAPLCAEDIGCGMCRVHLAEIHSQEQLRLLARIFCASARAECAGKEAFLMQLEHLRLWAALRMPEEFRRKLELLLEEMRQKDYPAVHHSEAYRSCCAPHYRAVRLCYAESFPALLAAQRVLEHASMQKPLLFAVDGRCGSGKSTLAKQMREVFGCPVFHLDDFFLPPEMRTAERLAVPGENVHHERFEREVILPFLAGQPVTFRPFDCSRGGFSEPVTVPAAPFAVAEGSYSLHPQLRQYYADSVFVTCSGEIQRSRLLARCGEAQFRMFETRWIPLEERYIEACAPQDAAGMILDTSGFSRP